MMGRHKLLAVSWRQYTAPTERHRDGDETDAGMHMTPGWKFVDEIKQVFERIRVIENDLGSPELHGGDYEEFSKQEEKIKVRRRLLSRSQEGTFVCNQRVFVIYNWLVPRRKDKKNV